MKYKQQILDRIDGLENKVKYLTRQINASQISGAEAVNTLNENLRMLQSIKDLITAEK
jgi:hypothetical protein